MSNIRANAEGASGSLTKGLLSSFAAKLVGRSEPGVIPSSLSIKSDPSGLAAAAQISYAQRYAVGLPRITNSNCQPAPHRAAVETLKQKEIKDSLQRYGSKTRRQGYSATSKPKSGNWSALAAAVQNEAGQKSGNEAFHHAVRCFLQSSNSAAISPPIPNSAKQLHSTESGLDAPSSAMPLILPTEVQRVIIAESAGDPISVPPALAREVSLHRCKSLEGRSPSRLCRLTTTSSTSHLSSPTASGSAASPPTSPTANESTRLLPASPLPQYTLQGHLYAPLEKTEEISLGLTGRSQSTPDVCVMAYESRTERLLNQHKRIEEQHSLKSSSSFSATQSLDSPKAKTTPKRTPSPPKLNPIPSSKAMINFERLEKGNCGGLPAAAEEEEEVHTGRRGRERGGLQKFLTCFCMSPKGQSSKAGYISPPNRASTAAVDSAPAITSAELLRKSITLLSNTGSLRSSGMGEHLLQTDSGDVFAMPDVLLVSPSDRQTSEQGSEEQDGATERGDSGTSQLHRLSAPVGGASTSAQQKGKPGSSGETGSLGRRREPLRSYGELAAVRRGENPAVARNLIRSLTSSQGSGSLGREDKPGGKGTGDGLRPKQVSAERSSEKIKVEERARGQPAESNPPEPFERNGEPAETQKPVGRDGRSASVFGRPAEGPLVTTADRATHVERPASPALERAASASALLSQELETLSAQAKLKTEAATEAMKKLEKDEPELAKSLKKAAKLPGSPKKKKPSSQSLSFKPWAGPLDASIKKKPKKPVEKPARRLPPASIWQKKPKRSRLLGEGLSAAAPLAANTLTKPSAKSVDEKQGPAVVGGGSVAMSAFSVPAVQAAQHQAKPQGTQTLHQEGPAKEPKQELEAADGAGTRDAKSTWVIGEHVEPAKASNVEYIMPLQWSLLRPHVAPQLSHKPPQPQLDQITSPISMLASATSSVSQQPHKAKRADDSKALTSTFTTAAFSAAPAKQADSDRTFGSSSTTHEAVALVSQSNCYLAQLVEAGNLKGYGRQQSSPDESENEGFRDMSSQPGSESGSASAIESAVFEGQREGPGSDNRPSCLQ